MKKIVCLFSLLIACQCSGQSATTNAYNWDYDNFDIGRIVTNADLIVVGQVVEAGPMTASLERGGSIKPLFFIKGMDTNAAIGTWVFGELKKDKVYLFARKNGARLDRFVEIGAGVSEQMKERMRAMPADEAVEWLVSLRVGELSNQIDQLIGERSELTNATAKYFKEKYPPLRSPSHK